MGYRYRIIDLLQEMLVFKISITVLALIVAALFQFTLGLFAGNQNLWGPIIFATLVGVTANILDQSQPSQDHVPLLKEKARLGTKPLSKRLENRNKLFVFGGSLKGLIDLEIKTLERWLKDGDKRLLLMLLDPKLVREGGQPIDIIHYGQSKESYAEEIDKAIIAIESLKNKVNSDQIEYFLTELYPTISVMLIDDREAWVSPNIIQQFAPDRLTLEFTKDTHPDAYNAYCKPYLDKFDELMKQKKEATKHTDTEGA
ncbi:MAG: hypothetical protein L0154_22570 [Chloroflexi bacterium]|nr:hypothetical protein [Chloroflexota bacterium]